MLDFEYIKQSLVKQTFLEEVIYFEETASTNDYAKTLKGKDNLLIITDYQTSGRGRFANRWLSAKDQNLTFTIRKHFPIERKFIQCINFLFSYFTAISIERFINDPALAIDLKWPNDILLNNKKFCGFLIESSLSTDFFCIGIGINVNQKEFPIELKDKTTSMALELNKAVSREDLIIQIINSISQNLYLIYDKKYEEIHQLWKSKCSLLNNDVSFTTDFKTVNIGKLLDVTIDGGIKLFFDQKEQIFYSPEIKIFSPDY